MRHFSDRIFPSEFQARHLDLPPSTNNENIQKTKISSLVKCVQTHILDFVRVSGEAIGKFRPAIAFDRLLVSAKHSGNETFPNVNHREAHASKLSCQSSACSKVLYARGMEIATITTE
jgi:hypothetical protein